MRLHNRQVKAAFWQDGELIRNLSRDGRMFYQGLWQLADDSGCLDDDAFSFKIHLFPGDMDILPDMLEKFKEQLVQLGKLIPYTIGNKHCLYLKNFHKHQKLDNPSAPEVPLPEWIKWEVYGSNKRAGKYVINDNALYFPYTSLTHDLQNPSNQNQNQNLNQNYINNMSAGADESEEAPAEKPEDGGAQEPDEPETPGKGDYTEDFEEFWKSYPRGIKKKAAFRTWNTLLKAKVPARDIIQAAVNYATYCTGTAERYIMHPSTFLGPDHPFEEYVKGVPEMKTAGGNKPPGYKAPQASNYEQRKYDKEFYDSLFVNTQWEGQNG